MPISSPLNRETTRFNHPTMPSRKLIGVLTPSSNTALEPLTSAMVSRLENVSAHFARFCVTEISLQEASSRQFNSDKILAAAHLLADAHVDVICWSGTSASWLGFEKDEQLCALITEATGIPATTSVLALNEVLALNHIHRLGLVTPYIQEVHDRIIANYANIGIACVAERHLNIQNNFSFAEIEPDRLATLIRDVAHDKPQAIVTMCTNLRAAHLVDDLEQEIGIPIYDSVSAVIWKALKLVQIEPRSVFGWGRIFSENS
jgi:maleate isomerase